MSYKKNFKKLFFIFITTAMILPYQNCGKIGSSNKSFISLPSQASTDSSAPSNSNNSNPTVPVENPAIEINKPSLVSPINEQKLSTQKLEVKWDDNGNSKLRVGVDISRTPFASDKYRHGDIARVGTTDKREFLIDLPNDGKEYYLRFLWTLADGNWGESGTHVRDKRFVDLIVYSNPNNKLLSADAKKAYEQAKAGFDRNLSLESSWYTTRNINQVNGGQITTEAFYHRIQAFHALAIAYEVTNDISYLQKGVDLALDYVNAGKDKDGDGFHDWIWGHKSNPNMFNHDHYEWRSASGIAVIAAKLKASGAMVSPSNALAKLTTFLEVHVWDQWYLHATRPTGGDGVLQSSFQGNAGTGRIGRIGVIALTLHMLTGESQYLTYLNGRTKQFAQTMIASYDPATDSMDMNARADGSLYSYDISHAGDIVMWYDFARQYGYDLEGLLDAKFYQRMANTLKNVIWPGSQQYGTYSVDGITEPTAGPKSYVTQQLCDWFLLVDLDIVLFNKAMNHMNTDPTIVNAGGNVTLERRMLGFAALMRAAIKLN